MPGTDQTVPAVLTQTRLESENWVTSREGSTPSNSSLHTFNMATNVYAPSTCDLSRYGFRWCNKDLRWERRKAMSPGDSRILANKVGFKVEVVDDDGTKTEHVPVSDDPVTNEISEDELAALGELFQSEEE